MPAGYPLDLLFPYFQVDLSGVGKDGQIHLSALQEVCVIYKLLLVVAYSLRHLKAGLASSGDSHTT